MNLKTILFAAMLLTLGVFVACTSDDEEIPGKGSLIALTKKAPADWDEYSSNPNLKIPTDEENACGKYALTARYMTMWEENYGMDAFYKDQDPKTATGIYNDFTSYLDSHPELKMNKDGSMPMDTYMALGQAFQVGGKSLVGDRVMFDDNNTPQDYLNDPENRNNVASVIMQDPDGNTHIANIKSADGYRLNYQGYNGKSERYSGGAVYYNNYKSHSVEDQYYSIIGVVTK